MPVYKFGEGTQHALEKYIDEMMWGGEVQDLEVSDSKIDLNTYESGNFAFLPTGLRNIEIVTDVNTPATEDWRENSVDIAGFLEAYVVEVPAVGGRRNRRNNTHRRNNNKRRTNNTRRRKNTVKRHRN
jgi:hypothetical protein